MPDPINPVPNLCSSVQTLDFYRRQINLSLQLTLDAINEELGATFTLPGIPPLPVQGLPEIIVPGRAGWDRDLKIRKPVPPAGFIGNRFGIRAGGKSAEAKLRIGELPGFTVGGTGGLVVGGTDPSTFLIQWINTNYQILAEQLASESVEWTPIQVPYTELCEGGGEQDGGGSVSPGQLLVNDIILLNNQGAEGAAANACISADWVDLVAPCAQTYVTFNDSSRGSHGITPSFSGDTFTAVVTSSINDPTGSTSSTLITGGAGNETVDGTGFFQTKDPPCQAVLCEGTRVRVVASRSASISGSAQDGASLQVDAEGVIGIQLVHLSSGGNNTFDFTPLEVDTITSPSGSDSFDFILPDDFPLVFDPFIDGDHLAVRFLFNHGFFGGSGAAPVTGGFTLNVSATVSLTIL